MSLESIDPDTQPVNDIVRENLLVGGSVNRVGY